MLFMTTSLLELEMSFCGSVLDSGEYTLLVDDTHTFGRNLHSYPHILFGNVELLGLQVRSEFSLGMDTRVGNVVSSNHVLSGNFTNL